MAEAKQASGILHPRLCYSGFSCYPFAGGETLHKWVSEESPEHKVPPSSNGPFLLLLPVILPLCLLLPCVFEGPDPTPSSRPTAKATCTPPLRLPKCPAPSLTLSSQKVTASRTMKCLSQSVLRHSPNVQPGLNQVSPWTLRARGSRDGHFHPLLPQMSQLEPKKEKPLVQGHRTVWWQKRN